MNKYNIVFRACDRVFSVHKAKRPFGFDKKEILKVSFYSLYQALQGYPYTITIIGDGLSDEMLRFFSHFKDVKMLNGNYGSAGATIRKQIELGLALPDDEWLYFVEDDYLHKKYAFQYIDELISNRDAILSTSPKKSNRMNFMVGDLSKKSLIIHPTDYPDRYDPDFRRHSYLFLSQYCHWRQICYTTHTFMLEGKTLKKFIKGFNAGAKTPSDAKMSKEIYGRLFLWNRALCISPIPSLAAHLTEGTMPPLVSWDDEYQEIVAKLKAGMLWSD